MRLVLAPMQGVVDYVVRALLTELGDIDLCVTEFVRIVDQKLPAKVYRRLCPELDLGGKTPSGTPVRVQLLGQDPDWLAENARVAVALGSSGIDLNFGCPAKTVNKSKGGAILLQEPELVHRIVKSVRNALPDDVPVSAKIRLGYEHKNLAIENAIAVAEAGASELTVHARTKLEGYRPPAHWHWIDRIRHQVTIPIVANGEVWSRADYENCVAKSGCPDIMLGRGILADPFLARRIRKGAPAVDASQQSWDEIMLLLGKFYRMTLVHTSGKYFANRFKQWLAYLKLQYPQAATLFEEVRRLKTDQEIVRLTWQSHANWGRG